MYNIQCASASAVRIRAYSLLMTGNVCKSDIAGSRDRKCVYNSRRITVCVCTFRIIAQPWQDLAVAPVQSTNEGGFGIL